MTVKGLARCQGPVNRQQMSADITVTPWPSMETLIAIGKSAANGGEFVG